MNKLDGHPVPLALLIVVPFNYKFVFKSYIYLDDMGWTKYEQNPKLEGQGLLNRTILQEE